MFRVVIFIFIIHFSNCTLYEGEACTMADGSAAVCVQLSQCRSAIELMKARKRPEPCSFIGDEPVVCCGDVTTPLETSTKMTWPRMSETMTNTANTPISKFSQCDLIPLTRTEAKTGKKARNKCIEYQEQLVYSCSAYGSMRLNNCWNEYRTHIIDGEDVFEALLGYGDQPEALKFRCGGTLISDKFVMTAAHCTFAKGLGPVTYVLLEALYQTNYPLEKLHRIKTRIQHPNYKSPIKYNDIALLEIETRLVLHPYIVPACLDVVGLDDTTATATGWGITSLAGLPSDVLLKVTLEKFEDEQCSRSIPVSRNMMEGFDSSSQICFGSRNSSRDTCKGDSGGPLQVKDKKIHCMYTVIGVTSFGNLCGVQGEPAVYTKVAPYVEWIESIVWPE